MIFCAFLKKTFLQNVQEKCSKKSQGQRSSNEKIEFTKDHSKIEEKFIEELKSPKTMAYPDFSLHFTINCDASEKGLGAVHYQEQNGQMKIICYTSRTLLPLEKNCNLHSGKLGFIALKWATMEKFRNYLHYPKEFTVFSNNNPPSYRGENSENFVSRTFS